MGKIFGLVPECKSERGNMFASRFTNLLAAKRITQRAFAKEIGMSTAVISEYCGGQREPTLTNLMRFALWFGVTTDFLLGVATDGLSCDVSALARMEAAARVRRLSEEFAREMLVAAEEIERTIRPLE